MLINLLLFLGAAQELIVLQNQSVRLEIDPASAAIQCIAPVNGMNWVETAQEAERGRAGQAPSGLSTLLAVGEEQRIIPLSGPSEVLRQTSASVALLSPELPEFSLRLQQEIVIIRDTQRIRYTVTVLNTKEEPIKVAIRNVARLPFNVVLRLNRSDGALRALSGADSIYPAASKVMEYWHIAIPPSPRLNCEALFGGFFSEIAIQRTGGVWRRRILTMPESAANVPGECSLLCRMDDIRYNYSVSLQSEFSDVSVSKPLVFTEEWFVGDSLR